MKFNVFTALIFFATSIVSAQSESKRFLNEAEGYSFSAPAEWRVNATNEGYAFVNEDQTVILILKTHAYRDHNAFRNDADLESEGLEPVGEHQNIRNGKIFRTIKRTAEGIGYIDTAMVYRNSGGGIAVVAISEQRSSERAFKIALAIAESIEFHTPKVSEVSDRVRQALAGKQLTYLYTASGYSERKDIVLCANGTFFQSTDMGGFSPGNSDGGSFAATGNNSGNWSISSNGTSLILRFGNGNTANFTISARKASNEVGLNGQRYFVREQNACR